MQHVATGCMGNIWECEEFWREWQRVLCAKCAEVEGDRQLMSFALNLPFKCVGEFVYLGYMLNDTGWVEQAIAARVKAAWMKFRQLGGILYMQGA